MDCTLLDPMEIEIRVCRTLLDLAPPPAGTIITTDTDSEPCAELHPILFGELPSDGDGETDLQRDWLRRNTDYRWRLHHGLFQPRDLDHRRP